MYQGFEEKWKWSCGECGEPIPYPPEQCVFVEFPVLVREELGLMPWERWEKKRKTLVVNPWCSPQDRIPTTEYQRLEGLGTHAEIILGRRAERATQQLQLKLFSRRITQDTTDEEEMSDGEDDKSVSTEAMMRAKETLGLDFLPCSFKSSKGKRCPDDAEEGYRMCSKHRKQTRVWKQTQRDKAKALKDKAKELKLLDFGDNLSETSRSVMSKDYMRHLLSSQSTLLKAKQKLGDAMDTFKDQPQMASRVREVFQSTTRQHKMLDDGMRILTQKPELVSLLKGGESVVEVKRARDNLAKQVEVFRAVITARDELLQNYGVMCGRPTCEGLVPHRLIDCQLLKRDAMTVGIQYPPPPRPPITDEFAEQHGYIKKPPTTKFQKVKSWFGYGGGGPSKRSRAE